MWAKSYVPLKNNIRVLQFNLVLLSIVVIVDFQNMDSPSDILIINMAVSTTNDISANWNTSWKWHTFARHQSLTQKPGKVYMKMGPLIIVDILLICQITAFRHIDYGKVYQ